MFMVLDKACEPQRATEFSSCVDLFARENVTIGAGETKIVPLGVKINPNFFVYEIAGVNVDAGGTVTAGDSDKVNQFLKSHCLELKCRSSLPLKKGLIIANGVGEIDLDYPDEIGILLHNPINRVEHTINHDLRSYGNNDSYSVFIKKGDKVAQIKLVEHKSYLMGYESNEARVGGFGSSDKQ